MNPDLGFCCLTNFGRSQQVKIGAPNAMIASVIKVKISPLRRQSQDSAKKL
jgi:hypothetical protein